MEERMEEKKVGKKMNPIGVLSTEKVFDQDRHEKLYS